VAESEPDVTVRRRRVWPWVVIGLAVVGLLSVIVTGYAFATIALSARSAQGHLEAAKEALKNSSVTTARTEVAAAKADVNSASTATNLPPVRLLGLLPVVGTAVGDVDSLVSAASHTVDASESLVDAYALATGTEGTTKLLQGGSVNLAAIPPLAAAVSSARADLTQATSDLNNVHGTVLGTSTLADARDQMAEVVDPLQQTLVTVESALPCVDDALGATSPKRYLLAVLNSAELRPSGGAPLSVALLTFDKGKLTVSERGQVSTQIIPGNPLVAWHHATTTPFPSGDQQSRFVNSNLHPDFELAGEELMRAWAASGKLPVDGVIAIDTSAIIAGLRATGPITTAGFGEVTADNFVDKWVNSYRKFSSANGERQSINNVLAGELITRLSSGEGAFKLIKELATVAPGRHVQVRLEDAALQKTIDEAGLGGHVSSPTGDHAAWFSTNSNASKTDVFSRRNLTITATVDADGGATVMQKMVVLNQTPKGFGDGSDKGYLTAINRSAWWAYVPQGAVDAKLSHPAGWLPSRTWSDGLGRTIMVTGGTLAARKSATISLTYRLPAGTFPDGVYRLTVDPQPVLRAVRLRLLVGAAGAEPVEVMKDVPITQVISVEQPTRG